MVCPSSWGRPNYRYFIGDPCISGRSDQAKQYLSCGVPVLASDAGENNRFVTDNFNGFLCNDVDGYVRGVNRFIEMDDVNFAQFCSNAMSLTAEFSIPDYCRLLIEQCESRHQ